MKKVIYTFMIIALALSSCTDDILDKKPLDSLSDEQVWSDQGLIDNYLTTCYAESKFFFNRPYDDETGFSYGFFVPFYNMTNSDEACPGWENYWGKNVNIMATGKSSKLNQYWAYPTIRRINIFLEKVPTSPVDEAFKTQRTAEARFLRAFIYFRMVERYGGVPIITKSQSANDPHDELFPKRNKEKEVYDFIIKELDESIANLPDAGKDKYRPSKAACLALKSRAAMFAASIAQWGSVQLEGIIGVMADPKEYWQKSYDASKAIIDGGQFALYNKIADPAKNYRNLFLDKDNPEVIFSEGFNGEFKKAHSYDLFNATQGWCTWGAGNQVTAYLDMVAAYENTDGSLDLTKDPATKADFYVSLSKPGKLWSMNDWLGKKEPRFWGTIITTDSKWKGEALDFHKGIFVVNPKTGKGQLLDKDYTDGVKSVERYGKSFKRESDTHTPFNVIKYMDEDLAPAQMGQSKTDYIVFRLGEILLNYAEAAFELGKPGEALQAVNEIRRRAGIFELTAVTLDAIRHERKIELAFEGNRYFDLRRWRIATSELNSSSLVSGGKDRFNSMHHHIDFTSSQYSTSGIYVSAKYYLEILSHDRFCGFENYIFEPKHYYLPISLDRITNNPNLVENPGY